MLSRSLVVALALLGGAPNAAVDAATPDEWRSRSVYQLLTDRFAAVPTPPQVYKQTIWLFCVSHTSHAPDSIHP